MLADGHAVPTQRLARFVDIDQLVVDLRELMESDEYNSRRAVDLSKLTEPDNDDTRRNRS